MKATCDKGCGEEFEINSMSAMICDGEVTRHYFKCSHCERDYTAYYEDAAVLELGSELDIVKANIMLSKGKYKDDHISEAIAIQKKIDQAMKQLRMEYDR